MADETKTQDDSLVPSVWAKELGIEEKIIQEVKLYSGLGWAMDGGGKGRQLQPLEQKMVALACNRTGLSVMGKQIIFLGNSLYATKSGKITKARMDKECPLRRIVTRPATAQERADAGFGPVHDDPVKNEYVYHATIYARVDGSIEEVSTSLGSAAVWNINLFGKDRDPRRLCGDMACTRAVSRALSLFYDFFGLESWEEVGIPKAIEAEAIVTNTKEKVKTMAEDIKIRAGKMKASIDGEPEADPAAPIADPTEEDLADGRVFK